MLMVPQKAGCSARQGGNRLRQTDEPYVGGSALSPMKLTFRQCPFRGFGCPEERVRSRTGLFPRKGQALG